MKNNRSLVVTVSSIEDLDKIKENTKYINLDITNITHDVIEYFKEYGEAYLYSDMIDNTLGYIYVSYDNFVKAENIINMIYANMPNDLTKLETARYLYIALAKCVYFDINLNQTKNEIFALDLINSVNNLWGALSLGRITDISAAKIYYYLCKRLDIDASLIANYETKTAENKLKINKQVLLVDLFEDIPYIQASMRTHHFASYNDDATIDKKIKYIKSKYTDEVLDKSLKNINYISEKCLEDILNKTVKLISPEKIKPVELSIIYKSIFDKYCPNYDIKINNLYLVDKIKKHFIMISYNGCHYSYNYKQKRFIKVDDIDILNNLKIGKIGLYRDEFIPNIKINVNA